MGQPHRYELFVDEAWTHESPPLRRYYCFYGGLFGDESVMSRLDTSLRQSQANAGLVGEYKWSLLNPTNLIHYKSFIEVVFHHIERHNVKFRQFFCDRAIVRVPASGETPASSLDVQFKLCYQFVKHAFGLKYLESAHADSTPIEVLVRFDTHSSQKHKTSLESHVAGLPKQYNSRRVTISTTFDRSELMPRIQAVDLLIGAAGSYGNNMHMLREKGRRGMTKKQAAKLEFARFVYGELKRISCGERGTQAFNWFESTGTGGIPQAALNHSVRIWKFKPRHYQINKGWERDNLDKYGQFIKDDIQPLVVADPEVLDE